MKHGQYGWGARVTILWGARSQRFEAGVVYCFSSENCFFELAFQALQKTSCFAFPCPNRGTRARLSRTRLHASCVPSTRTGRFWRSGLRGGQHHLGRRNCFLGPKGTRRGLVSALRSPARSLAFGEKLPRSKRPKSLRGWLGATAIKGATKWLWLSKIG